MMPVRSLLLVLAMPALLAATYLAVLTVVARPSRCPAMPAGRRRVRVLVPAHDEAAGIGATLDNLRQMAYPGADWELVVVADNCRDATAAVARHHGARVLERHDPDHRGKGHALAFAIGQLLAEPAEAWDTLVVVDADSEVSSNLLEAVTAHLDTGVSAVQATYLPRQSGGGHLATVTEVAFTAFHVVRSQARERLGLSCGLRGNGMAFTRSLLEHVPHAAFSRTEDVEFGLRLALAGIRVGYVGEALVRGDMPEQRRVATQQRARWIGGRVELARRWVPALLRTAVRGRGWTALDLAVDLLVPPVSVLCLASAAGLTLATVDALLTGRPSLALGLWCATAAMLALHVGDAARRAGRLGALVRAAAILPRYAMDKLLILARSVVPHDATWIRTTRTGELS